MLYKANIRALLFSAGYIQMRYKTREAKEKVRLCLQYLHRIIVYTFKTCLAT
jgi:hypothetical protein